MSDVITKNFRCHVCEKICKTQCGLTSHLRSHDVYKESRKRKGSLVSQIGPKRKTGSKARSSQVSEPSESSTSKGESGPSHAQEFHSPDRPQTSMAVESASGSNTTSVSPTPSQENAGEGNERIVMEDPTVEILSCQPPEDLPHNLSNWADEVLKIDIEDLPFCSEGDAYFEDTSNENAISEAVDDVVSQDTDQFYEMVHEEDDEAEYSNMDFAYDPVLVETVWEEDPLVLEPSKSDESFISILGLHTDLFLTTLSALINDEWVISVSNNTLRLLLLTHFENVSVQRSIMWNGTDLKIFVHNKELPASHFIMESVNTGHLQEMDDMNVICDHLAKVSYLVYNTTICKGVRLYSNVWERTVERKEGEIEKEYYQDVACLRDNDCSFLIAGPEICSKCHKRSSILKSRSWRLSNEQVGKHKEKVNVSTLTGDEAKERLRQTQQEKRIIYKRLFNMKKRISKFIQEKSVQVTPELGEDIAKIFKDNQDRMTPVQKLFWGEQLKALSKQSNPRQMRWNPFIIKMALHIQMTSSSAYNYLQNFLNLPSQRTLYDFTHYVDAKEGPQIHTIQEIQQKLKGNFPEDHQQFFNLIFDEVNIRSDIVINRRSGEIIGYTNLTNVEKELAALETEIINGSALKPEPAKKMLLYMALGATTPIQDIVGVYTTSGSLTAGQLYTRTWDLMYRMESHGLKVLCLVSDGASINKKFFNMHEKLNEDSKYVYSTMNLAGGEEARPLFFITDPVHVLKSFRNNFSNSYAHKKTKKLWKNGENISWQAIETLYSLVQSVKYTDLKLTKAHVFLTAHSCMKVIYAAQVMSMAVFRALDYFSNNEAMKNYDLGELRKFIKIVNDWFDCLNGSSDRGKRHKENELLSPYTDIADKRFDFLQVEVLKFFEDWHKDILERPGRFSKEAREKMFISLQTYESLQVTTRAFISVVKYLLKCGAPHVEARKFNQDKIEQFFGLLRMSFGANRNPNVAEVLQKTLTLHVQGQAAKPPSKGNTEVEAGPWVPDESSIPKRSRKQ